MPKDLSFVHDGDAEPFEGEDLIAELHALRVDRERILAAEAQARCDFESARDEQARLAMQIESLRTDPPGITAVRAELISALERWRWCWDCGARAEDCHEHVKVGRKCCPDCRHRDTGNPALMRILYGKDR